MEYKNLLPRFLKYVKINSRSDEQANRFPLSGKKIFKKKVIMKYLKQLGLNNVHYSQNAGTVIAGIPSNIREKVPVIGFLAHCDTADFNSENIEPQIHKKYDGISKI